MRSALLVLSMRMAPTYTRTSTNFNMTRKEACARGETQKKSKAKQSKADATLGPEHTCSHFDEYVDPRLSS